MRSPSRVTSCSATFFIPYHCLFCHLFFPQAPTSCLVRLPCLPVQVELFASEALAQTPRVFDPPPQPELLQSPEVPTADEQAEDVEEGEEGGLDADEGTGQ